MTSLITRFLRARGAYWRVEDETLIGAIFCLLQADVGVFAPAAQLLRYENKGHIPMSIEAWADAVDAVYLSGF